MTSPTTHQPAAGADHAAMVLDAAPIIAAVLAEHPLRLAFAYSHSGVTVTGGRALDAAFEALIAAFTAAGWGYAVQYSGRDWDVRESVRFDPPHLLTQFHRIAPR